MIELEKTYLAKYLPEGLAICKSKEIIDIYLPKKSAHSQLRIRKNGEKYEMTKKLPVDNDPSKQNEYTIPLTKEEFDELNMIDGKKIQKIRYFYDYNGLQSEIDVFQWDLLGLVLVDFEFVREEDKNTFVMPDFCLVDVTQEEFIAWWVLCGKKYEDIEQELWKFDYKKLFI